MEVYSGTSLTRSTTAAAVEVGWHRMAMAPAQQRIEPSFRPVRWALAWAGRGSRFLAQAPLPKPRPRVAAGWSVCLSPPRCAPRGRLRHRLLADWTQIRPGVSGNKSPDRCFEWVGVRADSEGRLSNSTPQRMHVMTAIGWGPVVCVRTRKVAGPYYHFRRHSVVFEARVAP